MGVDVEIHRDDNFKKEQGHKAITCYTSCGDLCPSAATPCIGPACTCTVNVICFGTNSSKQHDIITFKTLKDNGTASSLNIPYLTSKSRGT